MKIKIIYAIIYVYNLLLIIYYHIYFCKISFYIFSAYCCVAIMYISTRIQDHRRFGYNYYIKLLIIIILQLHLNFDYTFYYSRTAKRVIRMNYTMIYSLARTFQYLSRVFTASTSNRCHSASNYNWVSAIEFSALIVQLDR